MVAARRSARPASEVELKLEFSPAGAGRLAAHPALQACLVPPEERHLLSTYFDAPDGTLHKAGVYLRLREGGGRVVQTIKAAKGKAELLARHEWERELPRRIPDLNAAKGTALEPLLTPEIRAALRPVFETHIARRIHLIERDGSEIEVAIDRGEIATETHSRPICELELELKRGEIKELFRLARVLAEGVPLRLEVKTKAERGFELLAGLRLAAERATPIHIAPDMPAGEAFRAIALTCVRQIAANEPAVSAGKAEALHQMRIGLRRLRAAIALFAEIVADEKMETIKGELKWITQQLGPARELDVFAADVLEPLRGKQPDAVELAAAHDAFEQRRAAAYLSATAAIQSDRFRAALLDVVECRPCSPLIEGLPDTPPDTRVCSGDDATMLYTSGTTSRPKGVLLTHAMLLRRVWGHGYETQTEYTRVYMARLRSKLEDPQGPALFVTEPRSGYRFVGGEL